MKKNYKIAFIIIASVLALFLVFSLFFICVKKDIIDNKVAFAYKSSDDIYQKVDELETLVNTLKSQITSMQSTLTASDVEKNNQYNSLLVELSNISTQIDNIAVTSSEGGQTDLTALQSQIDSIFLRLGEIQNIVGFNNNVGGLSVVVNDVSTFFGLDNLLYVIAACLIAVVIILILR